MSGSFSQGSAGVPGGVWGTDGQGMASPQQGRPALSGGLQQLQMLQALRSGASMQHLQQMNPYTQRPTQFLPPAVANVDHGALFRQQQEAAKAPVAAPPAVNHYAHLSDGGAGSNGSSPGDTGGDGGAGGGSK